MAIIALPAFQDNYIWLIINETNNTFICVDPGDAAPVLSYCKKNNLTLTHILITHHHFDHSGGLKELKAAFPGITIFGPKDERIPLIDSIVRDEDIIHLDQYDFRVLSIPGHTSTHICYQEIAKRWLFCGDTLFSAGCGRVFDGTMEKLYCSLQLLKELPADTKVYCAHEYTRQNLQFALMIEPDNMAAQSYADYLAKHPDRPSLPSNLALEKKINPFLRTDSPDLRTFAQNEGIDPCNPFEIFKRLREIKDVF